MLKLLSVESLIESIILVSFANFTVVLKAWMGPQSWLRGAGLRTQPCGAQGESGCAVTHLQFCFVS